MVRSGEAAADAISRRAAMRRFGRAGLVATLGSGLLELVGANDASAQARRRTGVTASDLAGVPVITTSESYNPATCLCTGTLAVGHCDGNCPSGYWCYEVDGCGGVGTKYACLGCAGTPKCSYDC